MPQTVLVTTTFSKSAEDLRFQLALKTCGAARKAGYPLIIVDGSPDERLRDLLRVCGATVYKQEEPGMGASRREALQAGLATEADVIVWLEPEKYPFVPLLKPCIDMVRAGIDIVVPSRKSLESYPMYQELSELRTNRELGRITGSHDLDLMFGPRVMSRTGAELLLSYTGQAGGDNWELTFIPILWVLKRHLMSVNSVVVDYVPPPEQTAAEQGDEEMNKKRDTQRHTLVNGMQRAAEYLKR